MEYFAPELLLFQNQSDKVDIWCTGILLYELQHRKPPYHHVNFGEEFHRKAKN